MSGKEPNKRIFRGFQIGLLHFMKITADHFPIHSDFH